MYTVLIEWYSLALGHIGELTDEGLVFNHRTLIAAKRRLGSLIAGKQRRLAMRQGHGAHYIIVTPEGARLSWQDARNIIKNGSP